ncbi:hypothetical protein JTB14_029328 [Gonioctena quinquepunctata]|nr:hypothetical protein JTB14_029328 [Gonioctena quinquepunctata]
MDTNSRTENLQDAIEADDVTDAVSFLYTQHSNLDIVCEDGIVIASTSKVVEEVASDLSPLPKLQEKSNRNKHKS